MYHLNVIGFSFLIFIIAVYSVVRLPAMKAMSGLKDFRIVFVGTLSSMYISWLVVYMANVKPFISPILPSDHQLY